MKKKLILSLALGLTSIAGISAMDQAKLDKDLHWAIVQEKDPIKVEALIHAGANVNSAPYSGALLLGIAIGYRELEIVKVLLKHNALVNLTEPDGNTALLYANDRRTITMLLDAGADLYHHNNKDETALIGAVKSLYSDRTPEHQLPLLQAITQLTKEEKESVKNWLLVDQKLRQANIKLPKDLKKLIAKNIYQLLAQDLRERVIRAGGLKALEVARKIEVRTTEEGLPSEGTVQLMEQYLDLDFLENVARTQCLLPKQVNQ